MGKKVYFIIQSIISFLLSIFSIVRAKETVEQLIKTIKQFSYGLPSNFSDRMIDIYQKSGEKMIIIFAIIVIISSIFLFIFAINNTLLKHKGLVITFSILIFVFTDVLIVQLLGIASFIIILCCKRKNPEDFPDRRNIPKIDLKKSKAKDLVLGLALVLIYFSQFIWKNYLPADLTLVIIIEFAFNIIMIVLCVVVFYNQLKENFRLFKNNFTAYMRFIFPRLGMAYVFLFIFSLISILITKNATSVNQSQVESLPKYYLIPAAIIYAPIVEELIFRGVFRRFIRNKYIFIIISGVIFGLLHTIHEATILNVVFASLPYISLGMYLSFIYTKTNNLFSNIFSHAFINTLSTIFILFM